MTNERPDQPSDLGWLLEEFVSRVPGVDSALLASSDGMRLALAGLSQNQADVAAAVMSGLQSLAKGVARIKDTTPNVLQIVVELESVNLFVMSADSPLPEHVPSHIGTDRSVGTVLGVLTTCDADPGVVGYEMATLIGSVSEHLRTRARTLIAQPT